MRGLFLLLLLLASGACAATPEAPPPPATPGPVARSGVLRVTLEEPGLRVDLEQDARLIVRMGEGPAEEWLLPEEVSSQALQAFRSSSLFGRTSSPTEAEGATSLTLQEGDLTQVRAPRQPSPEFQNLARVLKDLVPGEEGAGPSECWIAGTLLFENLEGGLWKVRIQPGREYVLMDPPEGFTSGERVRLTGRPAPSDQIGIHMSGPYYQVLTLRRSGPSERSRPL